MSQGHCLRIDEGSSISLGKHMNPIQSNITSQFTENIKINFYSGTF